MHKLKNAAVKAAGRGKQSDRGSLWIHKMKAESGKWMLRHTLHGRRHETGLGAYPYVSLKDARQSAGTSRSVVREGKDAIGEREPQRRQAGRNMHVLNDIAQDALDSRRAELKRNGVDGRWLSQLKLHLLQKLGRMPIAETGQRDIRDTLAPTWQTRADTARKALNRLNKFFQHAAA